MTTDKAYEYINNALNTKGKEVVLRELNKKSAILDQVLLLKKAIEEERARIAAGMALRIEAAFYYRELAQDDALVYVYHSMFK